MVGRRGHALPHTPPGLTPPSRNGGQPRSLRAASGLQARPACSRMVPDSTPEVPSTAAAEPGAQAPGRPLGDATTGDATADGELDTPGRSGTGSDGYPDEPDPFSVEPPEEADDPWDADTSPELDVDGPQVGSVFEEYDLDLDDLIQSGDRPPAGRRARCPGGRSGVRTTSLQSRRSSGLRRRRKRRGPSRGRTRHLRTRARGSLSRRVHGRPSAPRRRTGPLQSLPDEAEGRRLGRSPPR